MNWLSVCLKYSPIVAIILNFVGAILLLFSTGAYTNGGTQFTGVDAEGRALKNVYFLNPVMFRIGIGLIATGFLIQMINELYGLECLKSV